MEERIHTPVLLDEVLKIFNPCPGQRYIDATVNGGGHAGEIVDRIGKDGALLGIDRDAELIERLKKTYANKKNLIAVCGSYAEMDTIAAMYGFTPVNGILFDLGYSSYHVDQSGRGFSFLRDELLDMRYNPRETRLTAERIVNTWSRAELTRIAKEYGEERFAGKIAAMIVNERTKKPIRSTRELAEIIRRSIPQKLQHGKINPATRMFQALRIAVNNELEQMKIGLEKGIDLLVPGGKMVVISFHSLEDRIAKEIYRTKAKEGNVRILTLKPVMADSGETRNNPRSRSAKMRALIKI